MPSGSVVDRPDESAERTQEGSDSAVCCREANRDAIGDTGRDTGVTVDAARGPGFGP
ncbi:MAG: hypothetical protein QOH42_2493 [Blastocatellia bacterium]|nr:hypothetical protein [Blastocatellia bacterium]